MTTVKLTTEVALLAILGDGIARTKDELATMLGETPCRIAWRLSEMVRRDQLTIVHDPVGIRGAWTVRYSIKCPPTD